MAYFNLPFSVRISNDNPIDGDRYLADDIASRDQLITDQRAHEGLQVYVKAPISKLYLLEQVDPPIWVLAGDGRELLAGNGITLTETTSSIEIATTVGTAQIDRFTAVGGETTSSLSYELDTNYKYQVFFNGVLQQEGAGADYTLTLTSGSATIVNFEVPLVQQDYVDIYYNTSDIAGGGSGGGLDAVVDDTSPQLGGTLDGQFHNITNVSTVTATYLVGDGGGITGLSYYTDSDNLSYMNTIGVVSGSYVESLPSGLVSGSEQISYNGITDKPTLVSGSSQISYNGITDKPTLVSGSSQIDVTQTTNYGSIEQYNDADNLAYMNSIQVLSGSISFDGLVSGSSQIDHDLTTNYDVNEHFTQGAISIPSSQLTDSSNIAKNDAGENISNVVHTTNDYQYVNGYKVFGESGTQGVPVYNSIFNYRGTFRNAAITSAQPDYLFNSDRKSGVTISTTGSIDGGSVDSLFDGDAGTGLNISASAISSGTPFVLNMSVSSGTLLNYLYYKSQFVFIESEGWTGFDSNSGNTRLHEWKFEVRGTVDSQWYELVNRTGVNDHINNMIIPTFSTGDAFFTNGNRHIDALRFTITSASAYSFPTYDFIPLGQLSYYAYPATAGGNWITKRGDETIYGDLTLDGYTLQASTIVKGGATSDDILLGDGTTTPLSGLQTSLPAGVVSGSSQITIGDTVGLLSGSRIIGDIQASSVEYDNVLNKPTLVSGSDQVSGSFVNIDGDIMTGTLEASGSITVTPSSGTSIQGTFMKVFSDTGFTGAATDVSIRGTGLVLNMNNPSGGWARGIGRLRFNDSESDEMAFGAYGSSTTTNYMYIGRAWNNAGLKVGYDGRVGIGLAGSLQPTAGYELHVDGDILATTYVKLGSTSDDILLGDGTTTSLSSLDVTLPAGVISGSSQLDGETINNLTGSFSGSYIGDGTEIINISDTSQVGHKQNNFELARDLRFNHKNGNFSEISFPEFDDVSGGGIHGLRYIENHKALFATDRNVTGSIYRWDDPSDLTTFTTASVHVNGYGPTEQIVYSPEKDKLYAVLTDDSYTETTFKVMEIDPVTLNSTEVITYDSGILIAFPIFNIIGDELFIANNYYSSRVHKFNLNTYSYESRSAPLGANAGPHAMVTDGEKLFITTIWDFAGTYVARVNPTNLSIEEIHQFDLDGTDTSAGFTDDIVLVGDYLYAPSEVTPTTDLWRFKKDNLSDKVKFEVPKLSRSGSLWFTYYDGNDIWYGGQENGLGKFNPETLEAYEYTNPFSSNINEMVSDGQTMYVGGFDVYPVSGSGYMGKFSTLTDPIRKRFFKQDGTISVDVDFVNGGFSVGNSDFRYSENIDVDISAPEMVASVPTGSCDAVFFDYLVTNGTDYRAGTVMTVHDGSFTTYTDNSTSDIGSTEDVTLYTDLDGNDIRLMALVTSNDWTVKTLIRTL